MAAAAGDSGTEMWERLYRCADCDEAAPLGAIDPDDGHWYCKACWEEFVKDESPTVPQAPAEAPKEDVEAAEVLANVQEAAEVPKEEAADVPKEEAVRLNMAMFAALRLIVASAVAARFLGDTFAMVAGLISATHANEKQPKKEMIQSQNRTRARARAARWFRKRQRERGTRGDQGDMQEKEQEDKQDATKWCGGTPAWWWQGVAKEPDPTGNHLKLVWWPKMCRWAVKVVSKTDGEDIQPVAKTSPSRMPKLNIEHRQAVARQNALREERRADVAKRKAQDKDDEDALVHYMILAQNEHASPALAEVKRKPKPVERAVIHAMYLAAVEVISTGLISMSTLHKLVWAIQTAWLLAGGWHCLTRRCCVELSMYSTWMMTESWELTSEAGLCPSFPLSSDSSAGQTGSVFPRRHCGGCMISFVPPPPGDDGQLARPMTLYKCSTADHPYRRRRPADVLRLLWPARPMT